MAIPSTTYDTLQTWRQINYLLFCGIRLRLMVNAQNGLFGFCFHILLINKWIYCSVFDCRLWLWWCVFVCDNLILELTQGNGSGATFTNQIEWAFTFAWNNISCYLGRYVVEKRVRINFPFHFAHECAQRQGIQCENKYKLQVTVESNQLFGPQNVICCDRMTSCTSYKWFEYRLGHTTHVFNEQLEEDEWLKMFDADVR